MNTLQELIDLVQPKIIYRVGMIISHTGTFCTVQDSAQVQHKVSGIGYNIGDNVLVENDKVVGKVSKKVETIYID